MSKIGELEQQLKANESLIARRDMALKLSSNPEFKKLILEDFMVTDAVRLLEQSTFPGYDPDMRADALAMAQAGGYLKRFLTTIEQQARQAENDIVNIDAMIQELRAEDAD